MNEFGGWESVERFCNGVGRGPLMADLPRAGPPPGGSPLGRYSPLSFQVACRNTKNPAPWWPRRPEGDSSSAGRLSPAPETSIRHRARRAKAKRGLFARILDGQKLVDFYVRVWQGETLNGLKPRLKHMTESGASLLYVGPRIAHVTPLLPAGMRHCSIIGQSPAVGLVVWYIPRRAER